MPVKIENPCATMVPVLTPSREVMITKTLEWVNAIRTEWGLPALDRLPPGIPGKSLDCVVARALRDLGGFVQMGSAHVTFDRNQRRHEVAAPTIVQMFIHCFDKRRIPELIDRPYVIQPGAPMFMVAKVADNTVTMAKPEKHRRLLALLS